MNAQGMGARLAGLAVLGGLLCLWSDPAAALERRRDQFGKDFGYYVYPIASEIPGLGTTQGLGATVLNMAETDADFTGFYLRGDFDASGYALLDLHLLPELLVLDVGYFDFRVAPQQFQRGITSDPDDYILPEIKGAYGVAQITLTFAQRLLELYYRRAQGNYQLLAVRDKDGTAFDAVDTAQHDQQLDSLGAILDHTDDRLDPRVGLRLEAARKTPLVEDPLRSDYYVTDYNLTGYIPFRRWDTLALNAFVSDAHVTRPGPTDLATLQTQAGLGCAQLPAGAEQVQCQATESQYLTELQASNANGTATALGGTQRLRSYPSGRFYAGHALFYGAEYRWNLTEEHTPFDIWIARGVRTGVQLAFFAERGSVAEDPADLAENMRTSYGLGFRLVLSGVVIRADYATGDEGGVFQLFINYPWSMFSVDNPG